MRINTNFIRWNVLSSIFIFFILVGCSSTKYMPGRYISVQDRYGKINIANPKTVYLCPTIDSLLPEYRDLLDPSFTPWEHVTDAIEQELNASGVTTKRVDFEFGPSFESLQSILAEKANKSEKVVYLGTELFILTKNEFVLNVKLFSTVGDVLFEKRGICFFYGMSIESIDENEVKYMVFKQIINDPQFKMALLQ